MRFTPILAILSIAASGALASPGKPHKPNKPNKPHNPQFNYCGNGVTPYCCNNDGKGGENDCKALDDSAICDTTVVCCNAQDSIQACAGDISIENSWGPGWW